MENRKARKAVRRSKHCSSVRVHDSERGQVIADCFIRYAVTTSQCGCATQEKVKRKLHLLSFRRAFPQIRMCYTLSEGSLLVDWVKENGTKRATTHSHNNEKGRNWSKKRDLRGRHARHCLILFSVLFACLFEEKKKQ